MKIDHDRCSHLNNLAFRLAFDPASVRVTETPYGVTIELPGGQPDGTPGGPALPVVSFEAALPPGAQVRELQVEVGKSVPLTKTAHVAPLQPAAPGVRRCNPFGRIRADGLVEAWPRPKFVPPIPELFAQAPRLGTKPVRLAAVDTSGVQPIARLVVHPVVLHERGHPVLYTELRVTLVLDDTAPSPEARTPVALRSPAQASRWVELTRSRVLNPAAVIDLGSIIGRYLGGAEYLVITDNQRWDAAAIAPIGAAGGDLVAEFERLAAWKRTKGLSARVVTITDIVNGRYGAFTGRCRRDLQEVLREFVKWAHAEWGTAWLLLGGDIEIVPVRNVAGFVGGFASTDPDPPEPGGAHWTGTFLKVRAGVSADTPLLRVSNGHRIPYDAAGTSGPTQAGWHFTDATYALRSPSPTGYVRVNGPAAEVNTELFWLMDDAVIPTDLYYADVAGYPERSASGHFFEFAAHALIRPNVLRWCDGHDWDHIDNGLYGQWNAAGDLDGVHYRADLSVGRAPVGNGTEAATFVNKVLAYEQQNGWWSPTAWLSKMLLVSSNWGGRSAYTASNPLTDDHYRKSPTSDHAVIQLSTAPSAMTLKLISYVSDADQRLLPFRLDASPANRGWRYAVSATDPSASQLVMPMPWGGTLTLPMPSRWIVVYGAADEMAPAYFVLDDGADGSMLDQEALRAQLATDLPMWSAVSRLYEDDVDVPATSVGVAPLEHLTAARLEAQLDAGQHIVSLSGHGYWGGCCGLAPSMRTSLTNGPQTFIAYADSCLTNQFDVSDAVSESLVQNEHGGAVAYVGNTRYSWIGVGDDFQRHFFKGLPATRALGLLHDRRLAMLGVGTGYWPVYTHWSIFALNLIGDPEMRVWTRRPWRLCLEVPAKVRVGRSFRVQALRGETPVPGVVITLEQPGFRRQRRTNAEGFATFDLNGASAGELQVAGFHPDAAFISTTISLVGLVWAEFTVGAVHVLTDAATVVLRDAQGERSASIPREAAGLLAALSPVAGTDRRVRLLLGEDAVIEAIELGTAPTPATSGAPGSSSASSHDAGPTPGDAEP